MPCGQCRACREGRYNLCKARLFDWMVAGSAKIILAGCHPLALLSLEAIQREMTDT